jgi:hypothetical protein
MKKLSLFTIALSFLTSAAAIAAPATTKTATLVIGGGVPQFCILSVAPTANSTTLDLTTQQSGVKVGDIFTQCNISSNGYSLSVDTLNASTLISSDPSFVSNDSVGYQINLVKTQGNALNSGGYFPSDSNSLDIPSIVETTPQKADILINTNNGTPYAGIYSDTLTFTLTTL